MMKLTFNNCEEIKKEYLKKIGSDIFDYEKLKKDYDIHGISLDALELWFNIFDFHIKDQTYKNNMLEKLLKSVPIGLDLSMTTQKYLLDLINAPYGLKSTVGDTVPELLSMIEMASHLYQDWINTKIPNIVEFQRLIKDVDEILAESSNRGYPSGRRQACDLIRIPLNQGKAFDVVNIHRYTLSSEGIMDAENFSKTQLNIITEYFSGLQ